METMPEMAGVSGAVLVTRGGRVVLRVAAGIADADTGVPCTPETCFRIASVSKQFTAAAIMLLVEDGALDLHEPIAQSLAHCPEEWRDITLHQLLTCTSGLGHWHAVPDFDLEDPGTPDEYLARLARQPLLFAPGNGWSYSSPGFLLAARILEHVTGHLYHEFVAKRIFEPLGMASTRGGRPAPGPESHGYRGGIRVDVPELMDLPGAGDLWSTVDDLARYAAAFDAGEILTESSRRTMCTAQVRVPAEAGAQALGLTAEGYGYGQFVGALQGHPVRYHPGDTPGYRTLYAQLPGRGTTVVVLSNRDEADVEAIAAGLMPFISGASDQA